MEHDCAMRFAHDHDSKWLKLRLDIKKRRADLLGLDQPVEIHLSVFDKDVRDMTDEELDQAIIELSRDGSTNTFH